MRKCLLCSLLAWIASCCCAVHSENVFVYLKSGGIDVFPREIIKKQEINDDILRIVLPNDSVLTYSLSEVDSISDKGPGILPSFTSFKFNNKYNDQVFTDVEATITGDTVKATVGAIGKRLTPSFNTDPANAIVSVDGVVQKSKESRLRFENDVTYTLGFEGWRRMSFEKVKDEVWSEPTVEAELSRIPLTVEMLSTNAPSNFNEGLANLVDDNPYTFFHSTWGEGMYSKLPLDECPYIDISLSDDIQMFRIGYTTRFDTDDRMPLSFRVFASEDMKEWFEVRTLTAEDGVPQDGIGAKFESPTIKLSSPCRYIRLMMLSASYKNYLCLSELWMDEVLKEDEALPPVLVSPAEYSYRMVPYGREVVVQVDWPTDTAQVPKVYIDIEGGEMPADKETYLNAVIRIDGAGVFPDFEDEVTIKGRGNSSWAGQWGKSPYRLKFASSKKPFGLTKGKSWVLLANRQTGSMLSNAVAMKLASMVETAGANRIVPVDLYMNGMYRGNYNFTQHVGLSNNSIDLDDETNATLLELDTYYDEDFKFRSENYQLHVNVKDPDISESSNPDELFQRIVDDFNRFDETLSHQTDDYANLIDVDMFARFLLVNELVQNLELGHPKSTYLYKEDLLSLHSRYVFGPVWDFDWAYGYELNSQYCTSDATRSYFESIVSGYGAPFFRDLRYNSEAVKRAYYREWKDFMDKHLDELLEYVDDYYQYVRPSLENNAWEWGDGYQYETVKNNTIAWLKTRAHHIFDNEIDVYDLTEPLPISVGDVNLDGFITVSDVVCILNFLIGKDNDTFDFNQADADANFSITVNDVVHVIALLMNQPEYETAKMRLQPAEAALKLLPFDAKIGGCVDAELLLSVHEKNYRALQFDLSLPQEIVLEDICIEGRDCHVQFHQMDNGLYRIVLYSEGADNFSIGENPISLRLRTEKMIEEQMRIASVSSVLVSNEKGEDYKLAPRSVSFGIEATGIDKNETNKSVSVKGGDALYIETIEQTEICVFALDGRCVRKVSVPSGKNRISLPLGVYVVLGEKIVVGK